MNSKIKKSKGLKKIHHPNNYNEILNEAEIIGIMLGDGNIMHNHRSIRLRVRELDFCLNFKRLIEKTYRIETTMDNKYYYNCYANSTLLTQRIIKLTNYNKVIPEFVMNGDIKIKARFLRGFFDSEASMDVIHNRRQIVLTQDNKKMLLQIKSLLYDLRIQSKYAKKKVGSDKLIISLLANLEKYSNLIGFSIKYKQDKLRKAIEYLKKCKAHDTEKYWEVLRHWNLTKNSLRGSAKEKGLNWETYRSWVYGMKMPCQIKKDIEVGWVPNDYQKLRNKYRFLPAIKRLTD